MEPTLFSATPPCGLQSTGSPLQVVPKVRGTSQLALNHAAGAISGDWREGEGFVRRRRFSQSHSRLPVHWPLLHYRGGNIGWYGLGETCFCCCVNALPVFFLFVSTLYPSKLEGRYCFEATILSSKGWRQLQLEAASHEKRPNFPFRNTEPPENVCTRLRQMCLCSFS